MVPLTLPMEGRIDDVRHGVANVVAFLHCIAQSV
jgi:hypothetical protein